MDERGVIEFEYDDVPPPRRGDGYPKLQDFSNWVITPAVARTRTTPYTSQLAFDSGLQVTYQR